MTTEFRTYKLSGDEIQRIESISEKFEELYRFLGGVMPNNREFDLVRTKLEEACFFAKRGVISPQKHRRQYTRRNIANGNSDATDISE